MTTTYQKAGNYSYAVLASCFSLQAVGIGTLVSYGVFFTPLLSEFNWPRAVISGASSIAFFFSGLFGVYVGRLNDRIGPKMIMVVSAVFLGAGWVLMAGLNSVWELYLFFGLLYGIGLSSVDVIALSTVARWFPARRGFMTGITKVGTGLGQFLFPFIASILIAAYGWRNAFIIIGIVSMLIFLVIAKIIRRDPDAPDRFFSKTPKSPIPDSRPGEFSFLQASKTIQLWLMCILGFTIISCLMSIMVHIVPHSRDIGISPYKAAGVLSTIGGVSMAGRFATGMVIDRIGSKKAMMIAIGFLITGLAWLQQADALWKLYLFACIYGLAHGGIFTTFSPIVAEYFGMASHGALFGLVAFFGTTGGAVGPILTGYLFDINNSYGLPFKLMLMTSMIGLGMLLLLRPLKQH